MAEMIEQEEKKKVPWETVLEKRLRIAENHQSIVIAPKTREGHILVDLAFSLDRIVNQIRLRAGTYINIQDVVSSLKRVDEFIREFREFVNSFGLLGGDGGIGGSVFDSHEMKRALVSLRSSRVILPRTNEAREVILLVKRLDPAMVQFRSSCTDFSKSEELFKKLVNLLEKFYLLVQDLSYEFKIHFRNPKELGSLRAVISSMQSSGEQGKPWDGATGGQPPPESMEESPKKGRKTGGLV